MQWLETDFLGYLDEWDKSVKSRPGFTLAEQKQMRLSDENSSWLESYRYVCGYMLAVAKTCALQLY